MVDRDGNRYYLHYDQVGSLRAVSDKDGNIIKTITYDTFGNIIDETNRDFKVPFGFAGGLYDPDTGLVRFGFRDYDPFTGRWTAKDPILFNGGDTNLYGYVLGDPVSGIDPWGLKPNKDKIYICISSSIKESFHAFLCANGQCRGLYPNPNMWYTLGIGYGYIKDDTKLFDNPNYDCKELDQSNSTCNKNGLKKCIMKFTNTKPSTVSNNYLYLYFTNCRTAAGMIAISCQIENGCWY